MGSVAEHVIHESETPVLVVRADLDGLTPEDVYRRPLVVSAEPGAAAEAVRLANGLADVFGGAVRQPIARCEGDLAREREASLMVVSKAAARGGARHSPGVENWIRSCALPMLFVTATTAEPASR